VKSSVITAIVEGQQVSGFTSGNIESSMITPADHFVLRMPLTELAWRTFRRGARISIQADGTTILDGFIGKREAEGLADIMVISGRDRVGRLVDESAPAIDYTGMSILDAVSRLASPWFERVTIDDGRNRRLRRGKGRRVASGTEPVVTFNIRVPRRGNVHPGESRWQVIHEIVSRAGLICYSSSDGKELFVGKPNQTQSEQYLFSLMEPGSATQSTAKDIHIIEDDEDRFSMYLVAGVGGQSDTNYGRNVTDNRGVAFDNPFNTIDGTGRDFIHPKRMFMPERAFDSYADAQNVAALEKARRDYHRHLASVEVPGLGQELGGGAPTLYAPDTIARVILERLKIDDRYQVVSCSYSFARDTADTTTCHCVPTGTEIIL
jgi:prophage tail gpP-like protein